MTPDEHSTRTNQPARRRDHAGMALFWLLAATAMFVGPVYVINAYTDHTAYAATLGISVGIFVRDYLMAYLTHALGVLNPVWASRLSDGR